MYDEKSSHDSAGLDLAPCQPECPVSPVDSHPDKLAIKTTWTTSPSSDLSPTIVDSESSPQTDRELESQDLKSIPRLSWPRKTWNVIRRCSSKSGIDLDERIPDSPQADNNTTQRYGFRPAIRPRLVEDIPQGYPRLAYFQASDEAFGIYRGFGYLHARVIIDLQYELSTLEQQLTELDNMDSSTAEGRTRLTCRSNNDFDAEDQVPNAVKRTTIMAQLRVKLVEYDNIVLKAKEMAATQKASNRDYSSVANWFDNRKPLVEREWYSLQQQEDMITLRKGREWGMFDRWIEIALMRCERYVPFIGNVFRPESCRDRSSDEHVVYYHSGRVEKLVAVIVTVIILVLLIIPVVLMYKLTSLGTRTSTLNAIGIMVVFTLVFSAAMSLLTKAKRHELFAASAAYCAVLVVFISNFGGPSASNG